MLLEIPIDHFTTLDGSGPYAVTYTDDGKNVIGPASEPFRMAWAFESKEKAREFASQLCDNKAKNSQVLILPLRVPS